MRAFQWLGAMVRPIDHNRLQAVDFDDRAPVEPADNDPRFTEDNQVADDRVDAAEERRSRDVIGSA